MVQQADWVERHGRSTQFLLPGGGQDSREQEALERCSGSVVNSAHRSSLDLFGDELHRRLKAVHIQAQGSVQFGKLLTGMVSDQATMAHDLVVRRPHSSVPRSTGHVS